MGWTVFYDDGSILPGGAPEDAPRQGVICIVQDGRILWAHDTYCWEDGKWVEHDRYACERYLDREKFPIRLVGYCVSNEKLREIMAEAKKYK